MKVLKNLPTWPRLTIAGMLCGVAVGAGSGMLIVLGFVANGVANDGFYWDSLSQLLVGVPMYGLLASLVGATIGGTLGVLTGAIAGSVLLIALHLLKPYAAAIATIVLVVATQAVVATVLSADGDWTFWSLPVLAAVPLTLCTLQVAADLSRSTDRPPRRDTFAA